MPTLQLLLQKKRTLPPPVKKKQNETTQYDPSIHACMPACMHASMQTCVDALTAAHPPSNASNSSKQSIIRQPINRGKIIKKPRATSKKKKHPREKDHDDGVPNHHRPTFETMTLFRLLLQILHEGSSVSSTANQTQRGPLLPPPLPPPILSRLNPSISGCDATILHRDQPIIHFLFAVKENKPTEKRARERETECSLNNN